MCVQVGLPKRIARVGDLRALGVTDAGVNVVTAIDSRRYRCLLIFEQVLMYTSTMGKIGRQA